MVAKISIRPRVESREIAVSRFQVWPYSSNVYLPRRWISGQLALQEIPSSINCLGSGCNFGGICLPIQCWPRGRGKPEEVATALLLGTFATFDRGDLLGWQIQQAQN